MDLRSLIAKLDKIEQKQLLQEAQVLLERLHMKDITSLSDLPETERLTKLAAMAQKFKKPGLFDPVTGNFVDQQGKVATIGAYKAEIEQLDSENLIPPAGLEKVSHFFGLMGKGKDEVEKTQGSVAAREQQVARGEELIAKALKPSTPASGTPTPSNATVDTTGGPKNMGAANESMVYRSGLARALTESFGYEFKALLEGITREEHQELKKIINGLKDVEGEDENMLKYKFSEYNKKRDELIAKIRELITVIKTKKGMKKESINESARFLIENTSVSKIVLLESKTIVREDKLFCIDPDVQSVLEFTLKYTAEGQLAEYVAEETTFKNVVDSGVDLGRGVANGLTFGWSDNAVAYLLSKYRGTPYGAELEKQLKRTEASRDRSPVLFNVGKYGSAILLPGGIATGIAFGATNLASDLIKPGVDQNAINQAKKDHPEAFKPTTPATTTTTTTTPTTPTVPGTNNKPETGIGPFDPKVQVLQNQLIAAGFKLPVHGADGRMGPETREAIRQATAAGKMPGGKTETAAAAPELNELIAALKTQGITATPQNLQAAIDALKKKNGAPSSWDAIAKALGFTEKEPVVAESIIYSSMTDAERMTYLRNRLAKLEEGVNPIPAIMKFFGLGAEAFLAKLLTELGKDSVKVGGEVWKKGVTGHFEAVGQAGLSKSPEEIAALIKAEIKANPGKFAAENGGSAAGAAGTAGKAAEGAIYTPPNVKVNAEGLGVGSYVKMPGGYWKQVTGFNPKTGKAIFQRNAVQDVKTIEQLEARATHPTGTPGATPAPSAAPTANAGSATATATATVTAAAPKVASKFTRMVTNPASRVARFVWNHKVLSLLTALAIAGYVFNDAGDLENTNPTTTTTTTPPTTTTTPVNPNVANKPDESDTTADESQLRDLLNQLRDGWPDDADSMFAEAEAVVPGIGGGTSNKPDTGPGGMAVQRPENRVQQWQDVQAGKKI